MGVWEGNVTFGQRCLCVLLNIRSSTRGHENKKVGEKWHLVEKGPVLFLHVLLPSLHGTCHGCTSLSPLCSALHVCFPPQCEE